MDKNTNILNWFEIATHDLDRATKFYETVFGVELETLDLPNIRMRSFPSAPGNGKLCGALVNSGMHKPSAEGTIVYFNANPDPSVPLARVEAAGGEVLLPKTHTSDDIGHMAFLTDTEGNTVAMHSQG